MNLKDFNKKFAINDKVYFGNGPIEFIGTLIDFTTNNKQEVIEVVVLGVETGCEFKTLTEQKIKALNYLSKLSMEDFIEKTKNEKCFEIYHVNKNKEVLNQELKEIKKQTKIKV